MTKMILVAAPANDIPLALTHCAQLQALVYSLLPPTTAINDYTTGLQKNVS